MRHAPVLYPSRRSACNVSGFAALGFRSWGGMSPEDEAPIMTALWIFSGRFSGSHTFAPSVRVKKGNPVDWHQPWRQIFLLFILLAGQASCDNITTTPSTSPTNIPTPVFYTLNIFVDTTGQEKNESEIIAWLEQVLQQNLEMCLSPITGRPSTRPTPTRATTIGNNVTSTTAATTTIESNSTTATTTENNITNTTPATTMENNSATTTAVNTEINSSTSPTIEHISSSASSTTENNTISTTTLERNSSTFTATTTSGVTTTLQTTSTLTMGLTSFTTPTTVQTSTTSTIKPSKGQSTTNATAATSPKATTPTNVTPTPPAGGNTITVATTVKTSTIPTTTPVTASSLTTAMAVSTITQTSTTAPTITLTSQTRAKTTTTPATGQTPATLASPTTTGREPVTTATPVPTQSTHPVQSIPTNQNTNSSAISVDMEGNAGPRLLSNPSGQVRKRREASGSMTPSSGTIENTTQIFQGIDVMCANKTFISQTECIVTLRLHQAVPPCCILRSLCARNENSSDILVVGRSVDRAREMSMNCSGITPGEAQGCMYSGEINGFCDADAFFTQKNPTDCPDNCTCSAFCHRNDSYYVFNIGIQDPRINVSEISSLIATIDRRPVCSPDSDGTCSPLTGAFKNASVTCRNTTQNLQHCSVILGFRNSVNICSVARAVRNVLRSHEEIFFDGVVTRAAICGSFGIDDEPLQSQFTLARDNRRPGSFCENIEQSNVCFCRKRNNVAVLLEEQCDVRNETMPLNSTTAPPNVTSTFNTITPQLNTTDMVNATTANVTVTFNSTTIQPNTTESINTTTANVTVGFNSTTTAQPNTTEIINSTTPSVSAIFNTATQQPNVTQIVNATTVNVTMTFNTTTQQPNTTQIVNATTVNVTMIFNLTTPQPNTTQMANATTTMTMTFNSTTLRPNTTQNVNATTTNATTTLNSTRPPERTTPSANVTAATPQNTPLMNNATTTVGAVTQTASPTTTASPQAIANDLLNLTRDISSLNSSQVNDLLSQLESLLSASSISMELANTSIHIVSNLLEASPETLAESTNRIINIVDTVGLRLELGTEAEVLVAPLLSLSATPIDGTNFQETSFSVLNPSDVQVRGDRVRRVRRSMRVDSSIPQASVTLPPSLTQDLTPEEQQQASRLHFNFYQRSTVYQDSSLGTERRLNSGILGANVANLSLSGLQDNVTINLRHLEPTPANFVTTCVFWDTVLNDGSGGWNPDGCTVVNSTDNETICGCNHLTSFAILLNLGREPITSRLQATILTFITYIGCGISAIFLSITLLTYLAFGKLRKDIPSKILIQLCFALLLLNLVFLVDAWLALYPDAVGLCISTAWFLHYFLLVSFTWMGVEAFHMYQALVKVFNSHISCYMLRCSVVGWGVPMIVVIIVIAIDKDNYGLVTYARFIDGTTDDFCWLRNDIAFYVAVVAYFCVIFVFNFAMFIVVLVQLHRIRRANPHNNRHRSTIQDVRSVSGITILLGLTWGFAFFAWGPVNLPFMYLFAIFNSLQGFFIFVFYCAVKENVRRQWRTYLCCGKLRLAENSEWSRTATQKTAKRSSVTNVTSVNSTNGQNSSSSTTFLVSDSPQPNNGVDNPLQDTVITADDTPGAVGHSEANNTRHRNRPVS